MASSPPVFHPAISGFYFGLAAVCFLIGSAVVRANRLRTVNLATGLLLAVCGFYFVGYALLFKDVYVGGRFIRPVLGLGGVCLAAVWFLRAAIRHGDDSMQALFWRTKWVWLMGVIYLLLSLSPGMIPYESTWETKLRGPLWIPLHALLVLGGIVLGVKIWEDCRSLKGARLFEAKMVAGGTTLLIVILGFRTVLRAVISAQYSPLTVGVAGSLLMGLILFGVLSPRLFAARSVFLTLSGWLMAAILAVTGYLKTLQLALGSELSQAVAGGMAAAVGFAVWFLITLGLKRWGWTRRNQKSVRMRQRVMELTNQGTGLDRLVALIEEILNEEFGSSYCRIYREQDAAGMAKAFDLEVADSLELLLQKRTWVSIESLERAWQNEPVLVVRKWLMGERGALVLRGVGDVSSESILIVMGERKDGEIFRYPEIVSLLEIANSISFVLGAAESEAKGRDQGKVEALKMLSASIGHDMKQHLAVLQLLADRMRMPDLDETARQDFLLRITQEVKNLIRFSGRLMNLGEASPISLAPVEAKSLLGAVEQTLSVAANRAGVKVTVEIEDKLGAVLADERSLHLALLNLGINAIEELELLKGAGQTRCLKLGASSWKGKIKFEVEDCGAGLPEEVLESLFEPSVTSSKPQGHGLGLYTVWDSVVRMGGRISHEVPDAGGARFLITLPQADQHR
ncbi:MAG: hypothetical protein HOH58_18665 [Opitutaceae bacterium]|nr:hypothetical protein [Opitutaceae bacterium]